MRTIHIVIGPTASGKSDRAVELALEINGEVINADSRQVYKGLDVGTGKITEQEMKGMIHHLFSYVEPKYKAPLPSSPHKKKEPHYSVSRWITDAKVIIDDIISRGKAPIICGGTGMYIYSLIYGLDYEVKPDTGLRETLSQLSTEELFNKYKEINGEPADNSISNNRPRLIRAIEIGKANKIENRQPLYNVKYIKMERSSDELRERITKRAEVRLDAMIEEIKVLLASGVDQEWLSKVGIEHKEIIKYLNKEIDINEMKSKIIISSLQYVKRQNTWNKKYFK